MRRKALRAAKKKAQPKAMLGLPDLDLEYEAIKKQQSSECLVWGNGFPYLIQQLGFSHAEFFWGLFLFEINI